MSVFLFLIFFPVVVQAQEGVVPYSIETVIPENQVNDNATYFDIEMEQGQNQDLEVIVYNSSDEAITVNVGNNFATTNSNGIIIYDGSDENPHESMAHPFDEISSIDTPVVKMEPHSQETVTVNVQAPDESFDGIILGGLYFQMDPEQDEGDQNLQIQNRYSYAVAVQITEEGNEKSIEPELEFLGTEPGIINHRTGLQTEFTNTAPTIIGNLEFTGSVYEEGSDEPLFTRTEENFSVAPNSAFNFPVMYDNHRLESGNYIFRATAGNTEHEWEFEEMFEVTEEAAAQANEEAIELEEDDSWLIYVVIGLAVMVVLLLMAVIYLVMRRKR